MQADINFSKGSRHFNKINNSLGFADIPHQGSSNFYISKNCCYPDEGWIFIGRFKVGSVPGMSVALEASKKSIKIHHDYDARPLIKSHNCY